MSLTVFMEISRAGARLMIGTENGRDRRQNRRGRIKITRMPQIPARNFSLEISLCLPENPSPSPFNSLASPSDNAV